MILRRLRGILGIALLWGLGGALTLGIIAAGAALILGAQLGPFRALGQGALTGLYWGLASGALFGSALMLAEQRAGLPGITRGRAALWGALSGIWFPALIGLAFGPNTLPLMVGGWPAYLGTGALGAISGIATLALARGGSTPDDGTLPGAADRISLDPADEVKSAGSGEAGERIGATKISRP